MLCSSHDLGFHFNSTMAYSGSIRLPHDVRIYTSIGSCIFCCKPMPSNRLSFVTINLSPHFLRQDFSALILSRLHIPLKPVPSRCNALLCRSSLIPAGGCEALLMKVATISLSRSCNAISVRPIVLQLIAALGIIGFTIFGLEPLLHLSRALFLQERADRSWKKSNSRYIMVFYFQPLLLWTGVMLICRGLDPLVLQSETSQMMKQRLLSFVRSLSTVITFAHCFSSFIRQAQNFFMETCDSSDERNMRIDLIGKAVYTAIWVAAVSLFMELLGFSTQKLLTAGGLGTVLLSLAGREIFTNFLSSVMIHTTQPFVVNERIKTKIKGYEVSGKVEHVGWWSPTIVRGADCEAVHIPNHKLSVNVVRNLSKKSHWRIKTHLAISHLDVNKIDSIIADMRKVLAKNPQVEQKKLHRRVFLEDINPENQALMILVSCFVKTPHSEEYLRVKAKIVTVPLVAFVYFGLFTEVARNTLWPDFLEAILLDLLRVISHHGARLATPIRTVQKLCSDSDIEIDSFDDAIFTRSRKNRPFPVIDPPYKVKPSATVNEEKEAKVDETFASDFRAEGDKFTVTWTPSSSLNSKDKIKSTSQAKTKKASKSLLPKKDRAESAEKGTTPQVLVTSNESSPSKQDEEKSTSFSSSASPSLGENIVLDVALMRSKQTLPIDEGECPSILAESQKFAVQQNGSDPPVSKDKKDGHITTFPTANQND